MENKNNQIDINSITDVKELKVLLADCFVTRENASAVHQEASNNIALLNKRISDLLTSESQDSSSKKSK